MTADEIAALSQLESFMREQLASLHFKRELDFAYINDHLSKFQLRLERFSPRLPALRTVTRTVTRTVNSSQTKPLQEVLDTLLFQFAYFIGETIDGETPYTVTRCEAVCRTKTVEDCKSFYEKFRSLENSWKDEVVSDLPNADEVERCADFFLASPGAKFCSDSCRFNSFALRKQMQTPNYQADKQRRYRERQKSKTI